MLSTLLRLDRIAAGQYRLLDGSVDVGIVARVDGSWHCIILDSVASFSTLTAALDWAERRYCDA